MDYQEGDIILCKVTNIVKTTVFVETLDGIKGSMVLSEVAPGRIRNLRQYVVPNKMIVCKVLRVANDHLFLSLRRVKSSEQKAVLEEYKKEKSYKGLIKTISGDNSAKIISEITKNQSIVEFLEAAREDPKLLDKYFSKTEAEKLSKILQEKKGKDKEVKKEFTIMCKEPNGIIIIKNLLSKLEGITYLGNSKFVVKKKAQDLKKADNEINDFLTELEKQTQKSKCTFAISK